MSIESVCNQALDIVGYKRHIGNILDGSMMARVALDVWGETRDEVLILQPWYFARAYKTLVQSNQPPQSAWRFEYLYPTNCVKLLMVKPLSVPADPTPIRWLEVYDERNSTKNVLANINNAVAVYTQRMLDPALWPADYTGVVIQMLAHKFEMYLQGGRNEPRGRRQSGSGAGGQQNEN